MFTIDQLKKLAPGAKAELLNAVIDGIPEMKAAGISTGKRVRHFLVQVATETMGFRSISENLNYTTPQRLMQVWPTRFKTVEQAEIYLRKPAKLAEKVYGNRMGNKKPGDAYRYRGSGFMQTTGRANFLNAEPLVGLPIVENPDLLRKPKSGFTAAVAYWKNKRLNGVVDRTDDVGTVRLAVNGGANGLKEARGYMAKARKIFPDSQFAVAPPKPRPRPEPEPDSIDEDPADVAEPDAPAETSNLQDLQNVERQLLALYPDAGIVVDGVLDAATTKALLLFKMDWNAAHPDAQLALNADVTPDVSQALMATPLPAERTEATAKDIAPNSGIVRASGRGFKATIGALFATLSAGALDVASGIFESARRFWDSIKDVVAAVPGWAWWLLVIGALIYAAIEFKLIERLRVKMHRSAEVA